MLCLAARNEIEKAGSRLNESNLFEDVQQQLSSVLLKLGFSEPRAQMCARLFAETTRDGVYTHGINRFPRFVAMIRNGVVDPQCGAGNGSLTLAHLSAGMGIEVQAI